MPDLDRKSHIERHKQLHSALDELVADFFDHTGELFSETTVLRLMQWSYEQTENPSEK